MDQMYVEDFSVDQSTDVASGYVVDEYTVFDVDVMRERDQCSVRAVTDEDLTVERILETYGEAAQEQIIRFDDRTYRATLQNNIHLTDTGISLSSNTPELPSSADDLLAYYRYAKQQEEQQDADYLLA